MKQILKIAAAAGIMLGGSVALAQSGNGSDVSGPAAGAIAGGSFTPLPIPGTAGGAAGGAGGAGGSPNAGPTITTTASNFSSGSAVSSPATGQVIPAAAVSSVGALITGGSPASVATVGAALQSSGAPAAAVATLTQALAALASASPSSAPGAIISAAKAFNALVANTPAGFFTSNNGGPPASFLAIHAALVPMVSAVH